MLLSSSVLSIIMMGQSSPGQIARAEEQQRLVKCVADIQENPEEAYDRALAWLSEGRRPLAQQCRALALVGLGQEAKGAYLLEELANAAKGGSITQRIGYLTQAGNAWLLAGKPDAALLTLENALRLKPNDPLLHADRAAAYMALENWTRAELDLDRALQSLPSNKDILKMRAETRLQLGDITGAKKDIFDAMDIDITDLETLRLRGEIINAETTRETETRERNTSPVIIGNE